MPLICIFFFTLFFSISAIPFDPTSPSQLDQTLSNRPLRSSTISNISSQLLTNITIVGLVHIPESLVRDKLTVFLGDRMTPVAIRQNIKRIEALGVFSSVDSELQNNNGGKQWIIRVKENPIIESIEWVNNEQLSDEAIQAVIQSKVGTPLNYNLARQDMQAIETAYHDAGLMFATVQSIDVPSNTTNTLRFNIQESVLGSIQIRGNSKTKAHVITRELTIKPGDPIRKTDIQINMARVFNLNFFSDVYPDVVPSTTVKHAYDLIINVTEKSTNSLNFGAGWGQGQQAGGFLYSDFKLDNFLGTGQHVSLSGQLGKSNQYAQFKYLNPWMFGNRRSLMFRYWYNNGRYSDFSNIGSSQSSLNEKRHGTDITLGIPYSYEWRSKHRLKSEIIRFANDNASNYSIQSYTHTLSYDTRDFIYNPQKGLFYLATIEQGFKLRNDAMVFTKLDATLSHYIKTLENQTIAFRLMIGHIHGSVPASEYYYLGGPYTVRGYQEYPYSFNYGKSQLIGNLEYRFLLSQMFQLLVFVDAGWGGNFKDGNIGKGGKIGKGIGCRIQSPIGPLRIDFGLDESNNMKTHFTMGHSF